MDCREDSPNAATCHHYRLRQQKTKTSNGCIRVSAPLLPVLLLLCSCLCYGCSALPVPVLLLILPVLLCSRLYNQRMRCQVDWPN